MTYPHYKNIWINIEKRKKNQVATSQQFSQTKKILGFFGGFGWTILKGADAQGGARDLRNLVGGGRSAPLRSTTSGTSAEGQLSAEFQYAVDLQNHGVEAEFGEKISNAVKQKWWSKKQKWWSKDISKRHNLTARYRKEMEN